MNDHKEYRDTVVICSAADDPYALPLCVSLKSVLLHLGKDCYARMYVFDGGISEKNKHKIESSIVSEKSQLIWLPAKLDLFEDFPRNKHVSLMTYTKMMIPEMLRDESRVIWLDSDMIVLKNLQTLWHTDLHSHALAAVQDAVLCQIKNVFKNYPELEIDPNAPIFNAGLMLMDLKKLRDTDFQKQAFEFIKKYKNLIRYHEQDAFNALLVNAWEKLDPSWNQMLHRAVFPTRWKKNFSDDGAFKRAMNDPFIVHFVGPNKPWHSDCNHLWKEDFFQVLDQTAWKGWRPEAVWKTQLKQRHPKIYQQLQSVRRVLRSLESSTKH